MGETESAPIEEYCIQCNRETEHVVEIKIEKHDSNSPNSNYSRHPVRYTECKRCGRENRNAMSK